MDEKYVPDYAPGQIVVTFKDYLSEYGKEDICKNFKLKIIENNPNSKDHYILETEPGKERQIIEELMKEYSNFIKSVELRDIKLELLEEIAYNLSDEVDSLIGEITCFSGGGYPTGDYQKNLDKIREYAESLRKI